MPLLDRMSPSMRASVEKIMAVAQPGMLKIKCVFSSMKNGLFRYEVEQIFDMAIVQNFVTEYADYLTVEFTCSPTEYQKLYNNTQDLWCDIEFRNVGITSFLSIKPILKLRLRAIIKGKKDITKHYPREDLGITDDNNILSGIKSMSERFGIQTEAQISNRIAVEVDLYDDDLYKIRKKKCNFILRDSTVQEALLTCAQSLGVKKVWMPKPDNITKYKNIIIPPMMGIEDVFRYLQMSDAYGVYDYDLGCYYTQGTLYIYPLYKTNADSLSMVHIYSIGEGLFQGSDGYHITQLKDTQIVCNTQTDDKDLVETGLENIGSHYLIQSTKKILDKWRKTGEDKFTISSDTLQSMAFNVKDGMSKDVYSPVYVKTDNPYRLRSEIHSTYLTLVAAGWQHAMPFTFLPGHRVLYHHDGPSGEFKKAEGVCNSVVYRIRPADGLEERIYTCSATIQLAVRYSK